MASPAIISQPRSKTTARTPRWFVWLGMALAAALAFHFLLPTWWKYLHFDSLHYRLHWPHKWWLVGHLAGGSLALLLGPAQFFPQLRRRSLALHRWLGRAYLLSILVGCISAVYMARVSPLPAFGVALLFLDAAWFGTSLTAFLFALSRRIALHREWMIRSYVVTFAFVLFRFQENTLDLFQALGRQEQAVMNAWVCWVVPLIVTEIILQWRRPLSRQVDGL